MYTQLTWAILSMMTPILGGAMPVRLNVVLSDDLNNAIDNEVTGLHTKSEFFRKAFQLYLAVLESQRNGNKVCFVNAQTQVIETELVGL